MIVVKVETSGGRHPVTPWGVLLKVIKRERKINLAINLLEEEIKTMPRSLKKGPLLICIIKKVEQAVATNDKKLIKTWSRRSMITLTWLG